MRDYVGVVVGIPPEILRELKRLTGKNDNQEAVKAIIKEFLRRHNVKFNDW